MVRLFLNDVAGGQLFKIDTASLRRPTFALTERRAAISQKGDRRPLRGEIRGSPVMELLCVVL